MHFKNSIFKFTIVLLLTPVFAWAKSFDLPPLGDDLIGNVKTYTVVGDDNYFKIAERFDVGYYNLIETNPGIDPKYIAQNTMVILPTQYVLPNAPREGIVINIAELRLYYFPSNEKKVYVYPVGIGREGTGTPLGYMHIIEHMKDPVWHSPESVRIARAKDGVKIPKVVQPGPDNPLGKYAMRLSKPTYLIHGTNDNTGVGRRSSAGCIRMYPNDIEELFNNVKNGTRVLVINTPVKVGRHNNRVYIEAHLPLDEYKDEADLPKLKQYIVTSLRGMLDNYKDKFDWDKLVPIVKEQQGIPQVVITEIKKTKTISKKAQKHPTKKTEKA